jgi:hypothetical protein
VLAHVLSNGRVWAAREARQIVGYAASITRSGAGDLL